MENQELLKHIYKDASMGTYTVDKLINDLKDKDNKIKKYLEEILKEYQKFENKSKELLKEYDESLPKESIMAKMMSSMGIKKEVKSDNSDSSIADMLIKGISMGSIEMEKKLNCYQDEIDKEEYKLAKSFLKFQQDVIEKLKYYL